MVIARAEGDIVRIRLVQSGAANQNATDVAGNQTVLTHSYTVADVTDPTIDLGTPPAAAGYDRKKPYVAGVVQPGADPQKRNAALAGMASAAGVANSSVLRPAPVKAPDL